MHSRVKATIRETQAGWLVDISDRITHYSYQVNSPVLATQEAALSYARKYNASVVVIDQS